MSYILEALKRSERQRLSSGMAALRAPVYADAARQPPWLLYGAAAALLIAAGIVVGWLRPWQQGDADSAAAPTVPRVAESAPVPKVLALAGPAEAAPPAQPQSATPRLPDAPRIEQVEELRVLQVKPHRARVHAEMPAAAAEAPPAAPVVALKVAPPVATIPVATIVVTPPAAAQQAPVPGGKEQVNPATASTTDAAHDVTHGQPSGENKVIALYELPPEVLHALPSMSISGYSYSATPRERMVGINDRLIQEGQYVADGLKLEEITPDGLIFSYKSYRFLKRLQ